MSLYFTADFSAKHSYKSSLYKVCIADSSLRKMIYEVYYISSTDMMP